MAKNTVSLKTQLRGELNDISVELGKLLPSDWNKFTKSDYFSISQLRHELRKRMNERRIQWTIEPDDDQDEWGGVINDVIIFRYIGRFFYVDHPMYDPESKEPNYVELKYKHVTRLNQNPDYTSGIATSYATSRMWINYFNISDKQDAEQDAEGWTPDRQSSNTGGGRGKKTRASRQPKTESNQTTTDESHSVLKTLADTLIEIYGQEDAQETINDLQGVLEVDSLKDLDAKFQNDLLKPVHMLYNTFIENKEVKINLSDKTVFAHNFIEGSSFLTTLYNGFTIAINAEFVIDAVNEDLNMEIAYNEDGLVTLLRDGEPLKDDEPIEKAVFNGSYPTTIVKSLRTVIFVEPAS